MKLWGAGGASAKSNRDRNSNANIDRSADKLVVINSPDSDDGCGHEESSSSTMRCPGQGGDYFSSNIPVSMNQNIWIMVGKGGSTGVDAVAYTTGRVDLLTRGAG